MQHTMDYTGKAAVFARGFMEHYADRFDEGVPISLRECQEAGAQAVADLGDEISVAYISKLGREMTKDKVIGKVKKGRNYFLVDAEHTDDFIAHLDFAKTWGTDLNPDAMDELSQRTEVIEAIKNQKAILIHSERPLPKTQYSYLMKKFNEGKVHMVFVLDGYRVYAEPDDALTTLGYDEVKQIHGI